MTTFKLGYKITERASWKNQTGITIKSNLAEDELVECDIAKSLVEAIKKESVLLEPDKLVLAIAEAQKREIQTNIEALDDMALTAKVNADKSYEILTNISIEAEEKFVEIEKKFSDIEKLFMDKMKRTAEKIDEQVNKLNTIKESLDNLNTYSLTNLTDTLKQLIFIIEKDSDLVKLVLEHKNNK